MKSVTYKSITIQNFLSIGKPVIIQFTDGINIITGKNKDKEDANGVGKSTVCDAFFFAHYGETLRDLKKEHIVNNIAKKNCKVDLYFDIDKNGVVTKYHIERGLAPSFCKIYVNDVEDKTLSTIPATNLYILNLINSTQTVFKNTLTLSINNSIPFMAQGKTLKREFIEGILRLEIFKAMTKVAKDNYDGFFKEYESTTRSYIELDTNIKNYEIRKSDVEKTRKATINDLENKIADKTAILNNTKENLSPVDSGELDQLQLDIGEVDGKLSELSTKYNKLMTNIGGFLSKQGIFDKNLIKINSAIKQLSATFTDLDTNSTTIEDNNTIIVSENSKLETIKSENLQLEFDIKTLRAENTTLSSVGSVCTKCNRPYSNQDVELNSTKICNNTIDINHKQLKITENLGKLKISTQLINKADTLIKILNFQTQKTEAEAENKVIIQSLDHHNKEMGIIELEQNTLKDTKNTLQEKRTTIKMGIQSYNFALESIKTIERDITQYEANIITQNNIVNPFDDLICEGKIKLDKLNTTLTTLKEKIAIYDVIKHVVSDDGIKSYMIKKLLGVLNERLNYYLTAMDANCKLVFDEYFTDTIVNDRGIECDYNNFSNGERKRIDLACLFAFMDLRRLQGDVSFNLAFYDELLDSALSATGSMKVFNILKERLDKYNESSYIITHRAENLKNNNITSIIYLEKSGGITKLKTYKEEV